MPWSKKEYPDSMKNLPEDVRAKAIEIANALLEVRKSCQEKSLFRQPFSYYFLSFKSSRTLLSHIFTPEL